MTPARPLAAERPWLSLCRADRYEVVAAAVQHLDNRIAPDPSSSPVQVGETQHFIDPYRQGRASYVHRLIGGQEIIVIIPLRADCDDVANAVDVLVDTVLAHLP